MVPLPPALPSPVCISGTVPKSAQWCSRACVVPLLASGQKKKCGGLSPCLVLGVDTRVMSQCVTDGLRCGSTDLISYIIFLPFVYTCLGGISFCLTIVILQENFFTAFFLAISFALWCLGVISDNFLSFGLLIRAFLVLPVFCSWLWQ